MDNRYFLMMINHFTLTVIWIIKNPLEPCISPV